MIVLAIIATIGAGIWSAFVVFGNGMRASPGQFVGRGTILVAWIMVVLLWLAWGVDKAYAHDHKRPMLNDWLKSLHSKNKAWCCNGDDTDAIEDWETKENRYRVKFRGQWYDVPESAIVDGPNHGGDALLWMDKGYLGMSVRCFMPGSMT